MWGGAITCLLSSAIIAGNTFIHNEALNGGAIMCRESSPVIINNTMTENTATYTGGAITCWQSSPIVKGNTIIRNIAGEHGGGIACWFSSPNIDSCIISSNQGDGIYCEYLSEPEIHYNNVHENSGYGINNSDSTVLINAEHNWWGDASGPGGFGPGFGEEVSQWVNYDPWLTDSVQWTGVEEQPLAKSIEKCEHLHASIFRGPLQLPEGKKCKVFDITGRRVEPAKIAPGIYFIEVDGVVTQKVIKVR